MSFGKKFDCHIHVGQYEEIYYYPHKIIEVIDKAGIKGAYVSSTTSCIGWNKGFEKETIISHIIAELKEAEMTSKQLCFDYRPLCWLIPQRILDGDSFTSILGEFDYRGFKIHPAAHDWNLSDKRITDFLDEVSVYAGQKGFPVFIHTGVHDCDIPSRFENMISKHQNTVYVLSHAWEIEQIAMIMKTNRNVYCDVAASKIESYYDLARRGLKNRIIFGSDFPITDYYFGKKSANKNSLKSEYTTLLNEWKKTKIFAISGN